MNNNTNNPAENNSSNQMRTDIKRQIGFIDPKELANFTINPDVSITIVKQSRHIIIKKIILTNSPEKEFVSPLIIKKIISKIALQLKIAVPAMHEIEGTIQDGLYFRRFFG